MVERKRPYQDSGRTSGSKPSSIRRGFSPFVPGTDHIDYSDGNPNEVELEEEKVVENYISHHSGLNRVMHGGEEEFLFD